jgi:hypothetical protein
LWEHKLPPRNDALTSAGIHAFTALRGKKGVDGRDSPVMPLRGLVR